jgi:hypothetical protein
MFLRSTACVVLALAIAAAAELGAADRNWWPLKVERDASPAPPSSWTAIGPLAFYQPITENRTASGFRPLFVVRHHEDGTVDGGSVLYPLFRWENYGYGYDASILNLINLRTTHTATGGATDVRYFDIWPFYFSRQTGQPETSYRAIFPLYGEVQQRFMQDRWRWVLFPLYGRFEKNEVVTTTVPWPFIKIVRGGGQSGFEFWPLGGQRGQPGVYRSSFALWPLIYRHETRLNEPESHLLAGFLPFYALDRRPGYISETFGWPFWGYVHRTEPYQYHARHYLWPIWVQGRGDDRYVNRWGPFYTHSILRDSEKRWIMWPVWRHHTWSDSGLNHERRQVVYFLYHDTTQRSATNPALAPARRTHLWPLYTYWDNGAGRRQLQALSPFEVFFPQSENVRLAWSPLFAVYRYDRRSPGETRHSILWDGITFRRSESAGTKAFHLGPLFSTQRTPHFRRVDLLNGLVGWQRTPQQRWRIFFVGRTPAVPSDSAPSP